MITTTLTAVSGRRSVARHGDVVEAAGASAYWVDPGTDQIYPLSFYAYRRTREAEEKVPARHRTLGADVDYYLWQRGLRPTTPEMEVSLTVRPEAPLRVRRMVAEVLRSIRRGRPAGDAIRRVSQRFGLAQTRVRAFLTASIDFEVRPRTDAIVSFSGGT
jgi:hypothetical protein